jgi:vacuolar protein sorting-associated protein 35
MEEQDKLLETATSVVREQSYFMRKAIDQDNLRDALKYASNMICELRTSLLTPRFYYELYMLIFQELQYLSSFFGDKTRHGKKLTELYESVQHAGNILPRLYLLITVGVAYIQSGEAPGPEILKDMAELCKGVQHPIRGLFLRYYLLQVTKDKLQTVSEESGLLEVCDFILSNFTETTRLWIRLSNQTVSGQKNRVKRERERYDLRLLVGASLVRLSQLEGMTKGFYTEKVLPRILEQVIECRDTMAQQYLLDCTVQVFPDDFHLGSLQQLLSACSQTQKSVDLRPVLVNLMNRLRNFLQQQ